MGYKVYSCKIKLIFVNKLHIQINVTNFQVFFFLSVRRSFKGPSRFTVERSLQISPSEIPVRKTVTAEWSLNSSSHKMNSLQSASSVVETLHSKFLVYLEIFIHLDLRVLYDVLSTLLEQIHLCRWKIHFKFELNLITLATPSDMMNLHSVLVIFT